MVDGAVLNWATRTIGSPYSLELLEGVGNSRVLKATCLDGRTFTLKVYRNLPGDSRDRLTVEYGAFERLWVAGVELVPRPVAANRELGCALYCFVEGCKVENCIEPSDVEQFCSFLRLLKNLGVGPLGHEAGPASEAFFSLPDIAANLRCRRSRLSHHPEKRLADLLVGSFDPALERYLVRAEELLAPHFGLQCLLPYHGRTLSPSDFGFHNAIKRPDGVLVFLDFEYFGWDDPAKVAADFLLHPRMDLSESLKGGFVDTLEKIFPERPGFPERLDALLPLFGLAWCIIFLNVFLPGGIDRRRFLGDTTPEADILDTQLLKAREMYSRIEHFVRSGLPPHMV
ncbi:MAG: hypothetical protein HY795_03580 [Desulfovibrio sp.]|nr:hypothetical protein [Desulfovibrio sp.]MBI4957958.1 hypothetical protein [Desulfovibrio sp.]